MVQKIALFLAKALKFVTMIIAKLHIIVISTKNQKNTVILSLLRKEFYFGREKFQKVLGRVFSGREKFLNL